MRIRNFLIAVAVLAIAVPGFANAEGGFKVTGGGQALATQDGSSVRGPGDTYGFNAQDTDGDAGDEAKGQFQTIQRDADATTAKGKAIEGGRFHGEVTCLVSLGDDDPNTPATARFGGVVRGGDPAAPDALLFTVDVTDNGQGAEATASDVIAYRTYRPSDADDPTQAGDQTPQNPCDYDEDRTDGETNLARGNVKIHNDPDGQ